MESEAIFKRVESDLCKYEAEMRWHHAPVIHGDPVFSNVLLTDDGKGCHRQTRDVLAIAACHGCLCLSHTLPMRLA